MRRLSLVEMLLFALLLSSLSSIIRQSGLEAAIRRVDDSLVDLHNRMISESGDVRASSTSLAKSCGRTVAVVT